MPSVKITKEVIKLCFYADIPTYLWGPTASAKTSLVKQVAYESLNVPVISLFFQTQEPGDILGLPHVQIMFPDGSVEDLGQQDMVSTPKGAKTKKKQDGGAIKVTSWAAPEWFQYILENPKEGIIFGDEANRAQPDTAQTFTCLVTERKFHIHEVPPGWRFIFASNYGSEYDVRELDAAIMARFCHLKIDPTITEWLEWGKGENATAWGKMHDRVLKFIESSPTYLVQGDADQKGGAKGWQPLPNRRTWEWVSHALYAYDKYGHKLDPELKEVALRSTIQGLVGEAISPELLTDKIINVAAILKDPEKFDIKDINRFSREIIPVLEKSKCTVKAYANLKKILLDKCKERRDLSFNIARSILRSDGTTNTWGDKLRDDEDVKEFYQDIREEANKGSK